MEDESQAVDHEHGFVIAVNTKDFTVPSAQVTYDQVVDLAFPSGSSDANSIFRVEFEDAASQPHNGALVQGKHTEVKRHGTEFSVIRSVRS